MTYSPWDQDPRNAGLQSLHAAPPPAPPYPAPPYPGVAYAAYLRPGPGEPFDGAVHPRDLSRPLYGANPVQAVARFFQNYARFSGRASRSEYWWSVLALTVLQLLCWIALPLVFAALLAATNSVSSDVSDSIASVFFFTMLAVSAALVIPRLAITWRRLHDAGYSGGFIFMSLIPLVGGILALVFLCTRPNPEGRRYDRPRF